MHPGTPISPLSFSLNAKVPLARLETVRLPVAYSYSNTPKPLSLWTALSQEEQLYFLSFVGTEKEGIKHAVVRKDLHDAGDTAAGLGPYVYRCGKVGPCASLGEVLRVIAGILPSGLLLDDPLPTDALGDGPRLSSAASGAAARPALPSTGVGTGAASSARRSPIPGSSPIR